MDVIVQPPSQIRLGDRLHPPIVIQLQIQSSQASSIAVRVDDGRFWALACVVSENGDVALAPPEPNLISGTLATAIHNASPNDESGTEGYVTFSNLAFHQAGRFRIRVSLMRMPTGEDFAAVNERSVVTRVIHVVPR